MPNLVPASVLWWWREEGLRNQLVDVARLLANAYGGVSSGPVDVAVGYLRRVGVVVVDLQPTQVRYVVCARAARRFTYADPLLVDFVHS